MSFEAYDNLLNQAVDRLFNPVDRPAAPQAASESIDDRLRKKIHEIRSAEVVKSYLSFLKAKILETPFTIKTVFRATYPPRGLDEILEELENLGFHIRRSSQSFHLYWSLSPFSDVENIKEYIDLGKW